MCSAVSLGPARALPSRKTGTVLEYASGIEFAPQTASAPANQNVYFASTKFKAVWRHEFSSPNAKATFALTTLYGWNFLAFVAKFLPEAEKLEMPRADWRTKMMNCSSSRQLAQSELPTGLVCITVTTT